MNIIHNDVIRKIVLAFGNLFSQIPVVRYDDNGNEKERFIISLIYSAKEQYVHRLNDDPELNSRVQVVIPTLSYEMMGMNYDSSRKQITNNKNFFQSGDQLLSQYNPVPYDFDFDLHLYSRTFEDAHQVVEHILSYFTPDYTIKVNLIPSMGIIKEIPILLKSVDRDVDYEGDREDNSRRIIFSFHFTVKGFIFGKTSDITNKLITHTITNIISYPDPNGVFNFKLSKGNGTFKSGEYVYQGLSLRNSTASAKVVNVDQLNNTVHLTELRGDFIPSEFLNGSISQAKYLYSYSSPSANTLVKIDSVVTPNTALPEDRNWTVNTTITEYP